jgi:phospholipid/cholesterol/gamma-HCH transport system permease protein
MRRLALALAAPAAVSILGGRPADPGVSLPVTAVPCRAMRSRTLPPGAEPTSERYRIVRKDADGGAIVIAIEGRLTLADGSRLREAILGCASPASGSYTLDLAGIEALDSGTAAILVGLEKELSRQGAKAEIVGIRGNVGALVGLFSGREPKVDERGGVRKIGALDQIGRTTLELVALVRGSLAFLGDVLAEGAAALRAPRSLNWRDVGPIAERTGADALPIVGLILFLLGLILAFQAAVQLHQFGADIYVADAVAVSVARELGPLMVAIILAGRSGGAFAAELGTMKVNEEVDALRAIGLSPQRYLVFPRLLALVITVPILTLMGDAIAVFGGFLIGVFGLDIPANGYLIQTKSALSLWSVGSGVMKSVVFAATIALIGCERGLATSGGATGVGRSTTSAVVSILFALVVIDFAFTLLFQAHGL